MNKIIIHKHRIILFSLLLFIATQYGAMVHASLHFFHVPDNSCFTFGTIEHSAPGLFSHDISLKPVIPEQTRIIDHYSLIKPAAYYITLPSRAPPLA